MLLSYHFYSLDFINYLNINRLLINENPHFLILSEAVPLSINNRGDSLEGDYLDIYWVFWIMWGFFTTEIYKFLAFGKLQGLPLVYVLTNTTPK